MPLFHNTNYIGIVKQIIPSIKYFFRLAESITFYGSLKKQRMSKIAK